MAANSSTRLVTRRPARWSGGAGEIAIGLTAGGTSWIAGRAEGARFTGASVSLKVVSGESTRGTVDTRIAANASRRTDIPRSRPTPNPPDLIQILAQKYSWSYELSMTLSGGMGRRSWAKRPLSRLRWRRGEPQVEDGQRPRGEKHRRFEVLRSMANAAVRTWSKCRFLRFLSRRQSVHLIWTRKRWRSG
jgi:hypothetical protein